MGWALILDIDNNTSSAEDNPFAGHKSQPTGKVSVCMPSDDWLCIKLKKLDLTTKVKGQWIAKESVCPSSEVSG